MDRWVGEWIGRWVGQDLISMPSSHHRLLGQLRTMPRVQSPLQKSRLMVGSKPATGDLYTQPFAWNFSYPLYSDGTVATIGKTLIFVRKDHPGQKGSSPETMQTLAKAAQIAEQALQDRDHASREVHGVNREETCTEEKRRDSWPRRLVCMD